MRPRIAHEVWFASARRSRVPVFLTLALVALAAAALVLSHCH